jgi:hypothetical protein
LLVVVVAAGGVEAALHWRGESKRPSTNAASSGYVSPRATPSGAAPSASPSAAISSTGDAPTSSPPVTYPQSLTATPPAPVTSPAATTAPAVAPTTASPAPTTSAARPAVDILNSTHVAGMAARADTTLTHGGWVVGVTGNYPHLLSETTVFYPAGQQAAAQALAAQFTAIAKVEPAPAGVSTADLTLVLAQDWTSSGK